MDEDNDLIVVSANGRNSYCLDKYTNGTTDLRDDPSQDISPCKVKLTHGDGREEVMFTMERRLNTGDDDDFPVTLD